MQYYYNLIAYFLKLLAIKKFYLAEEHFGNILEPEILGNHNINTGTTLLLLTIVN